MIPARLSSPSTLALGVLLLGAGLGPTHAARAQPAPTATAANPAPADLPSPGTNPSVEEENDTPKDFKPVTIPYDYVRREVMIPMRDGVKLHTVLLVPKTAVAHPGQAPILLNRTPYDADARTTRTKGDLTLAGAAPQMVDTAVAAGYIFVSQDVRGKYGSEGAYVMTRSLVGPYNAARTDHSTDCYDTVDWLVKNVPEANGRVGAIGGSYEGFTTVMCTINPHPAMRAAVPFAPMIDGWMGDDWFHQGAFRQEGFLSFIYNQEATRGNKEKWWGSTPDSYDFFLRNGSPRDIASARGMEQLGFWRRVVEHPAYDGYWQDQAVDRQLARRPLTVPTLLTGGLFDQEDIYGSPAAFAALAPKDPNGEKAHLVLGPWNHGQGRREGRALGPIAFAGDTAGWYRKRVMQPFLDHWLKDAPNPRTPRVLAYETGADEWRTYDAWPPKESTPRPLYLRAGGAASFAPPTAAEARFDEYVADPAKPVPYRARPIGAETGWGEWLVEDQRPVASRPDVLVYETPVLTAPLRLAGQPVAEIIASTTGTDADWVVKLIDVYPDSTPDQPKLAGYQLMISADILRGRYRESFTTPKPIAPGKPLTYTVRLPAVNHTVLPGHRLMVQIQSSWFPLYDRNPQTFIPNMMLAKASDYTKATQRVWHGSAAGLASRVVLPAMPADAADAPGVPRPAGS